LKLLPRFIIISAVLVDISQGIKLFNNADFFSAHDFFESCWIECDKADKLFFQGMVQISVGCYHLISGNQKGCLSQFRKGIEKLRVYLPSHKNINLEPLVRKIELLSESLDENLFNQDIKKFWNRIPIIETKY
jgi:hypothetical protein